MAGRVVDLAVTRVAVVTTIAAFPAITAVEVLAGINITPYLKDIDFDADDSDKVEERSIQETSKIEVPTIGNYHASLTMFDDFTAGVPLSTSATPRGVFGTPYSTSYLVMRTGLASTTAFAASDVCKAALFRWDKLKTPGGKNDGYLKCMVTGLQQGLYATSVILG
jgi:hypothetical protein